MKNMTTRKQNLKGIFKAIVDNFFVNAYADEENPTEGGGSQSTINYEHLIAQARKEEKDKLYGQIEKLKAQVEVLTKQNNESLLAKGKAETELADLKKKADKGDSEEVAKLKEQIAKLEEENKKLKEETPNAEEIRKEIEAEYEVKLYAKEQLAENKDKILSVFAEKVEGKTKEEIDEAIKKAIESSDSIRKELGVDEKDSKDKKEKKESKDAEKKDKKETPANPPAPNPTNDNSTDKFNLEEVAKLDPRSKEYAEWRKSVGLK